jgi:hypothetical protein
MEKILRIEEISFKGGNNDWSAKDGYQVITDTQTIKMGMDTETSCCENPGYFMSNDNLSEFEGAELYAIKLTDTALNGVDFKKGGMHSNPNDPDSYFEGGIMFVTLETSKGPLQFVAYNEQNGYYGHEACVISKQLNHTEYL